jgi:hypothetical protein
MNKLGGARSVTRFWPGKTHYWRRALKLRSARRAAQSEMNLTAVFALWATNHQAKLIHKAKDLFPTFLAY